MGNPASNTQECFREFIGQELIGLLFGRVPQLASASTSLGTTMIFRDGRGLFISATGAWWVVSADDVRAAVRHRRDELIKAHDDLQTVLIMDRLLEAAEASA